MSERLKERKRKRNRSTKREREREDACESCNLVLRKKQVVLVTRYTTRPDEKKSLRMNEKQDESFKACCKCKKSSYTFSLQVSSFI